MTGKKKNRRRTKMQILLSRATGKGGNDSQITTAIQKIQDMPAGHQLEPGATTWKDYLNERNASVDLKMYLKKKLSDSANKESGS